mmetsp:Transcript_10372/g.42910  ORF Transcript_10372/g.42910 Transcript_10372/m.42910 type:complete len:218 (+) Transcript_10372:441-1094(+)
MCARAKHAGSLGRLRRVLRGESRSPAPLGPFEGGGRPRRRRWRQRKRWRGGVRPGRRLSAELSVFGRAGSRLFLGRSARFALGRQWHERCGDESPVGRGGLHAGVRATHERRCHARPRAGTRGARLCRAGCRRCPRGGIRRPFPGCCAQWHARDVHEPARQRRGRADPLGSQHGEPGAIRGEHRGRDGAAGGCVRLARARGGPGVRSGARPEPDWRG